MNQLVFAPQTTISGRVAVIVARDLGRIRQCDGSDPHWALRGLDLDIPAGAFVGLIGPAGSGKSTLVRLLAGFERPSAGKLSIGGVCLDELDESEGPSFRARSVSVVFPSQNLLPKLTLQQNMELPLLLASLSRRERRERAESALWMVGLGAHRARLPHELAVVDQQRAAIARSLLNGANLILADEPCSLLPPNEHGRVLDLLSQLNSVFRKTIVLATRDESVAARSSLVQHLVPEHARPCDRRDRVRTHAPQPFIPALSA